MPARMSAYICLAPVGRRIAFKFDIVKFSEKSVDKHQIWLKPGKN